MTGDPIRGRGSACGAREGRSCMSLAPWVASGVISEDTSSPLTVALRLVDLYDAVPVEEATLI